MGSTDQKNPHLTAYPTSADVLRTPTFCMILALCVPTVFLLIKSFSAIWFVVSPALINSKICRSRAIAIKAANVDAIERQLAHAE